LLEEAIAGGFDGSGEFDLLLTEAFGTDEDWPELVEAMRANVPAPSIEILDWPTPDPSRVEHGKGLARVGICPLEARQCSC
jgi:hypothetical protein